MAHWIDDGLLIGLDKHKGRDWLENSARSSDMRSVAHCHQVGFALGEAIARVFLSVLMVNVGVGKISVTLSKHLWNFFQEASVSKNRITFALLPP